MRKMHYAVVGRRYADVWTYTVWCATTNCTVKTGFQSEAEAFDWLKRHQMIAGIIARIKKSA